MSKKSVLAAVITRNRRVLLERCLLSIKKQVYKADDILIVNNDSQDDTLSFLIKENYSFITQPNLGSAGGWNAAIQYFLKKNYDYIWLMDDDGYADENALKNLINHIKPSVSCISSIVVKEDDKRKFVFPMSILNINNEPVLFAFKRKEEYVKKIFSSNLTYNYAHLFNGALIPKNIILKIGNVDKRYFVAGDELDFYYRLKSVGEIISLKNAVHYHPNVDNRPFSELWIYYYLKNGIIINKKYRNLIFLRNFLLIIRCIERVYSKNGILFFLKFFFSKKILIFFRGIINGINNKLEVDFYM